jgi:NADH-quinone oxidoreductase subunit M
MLAEFPWLTLIIWLPIIGGVAVIASGDKAAELTKRIALASRC